MPRTKQAKTETAPPPTKPPTRKARPPKSQAASELITELGGFQVGEKVFITKPGFEGQQGEITGFLLPKKVFIQLEGFNTLSLFLLSDIEPVEEICGAADLPLSPQPAETPTGLAAAPQQLSLLDLIGLIKTEHNASIEAGKSMLTHARKAGEYLSQARDQVAGNWLGWLAANFEFSKSTAYNYLRVFKKWDEIENFQRAGNDIESIREALAAIAPAKDDEPLPILAAIEEAEPAKKGFVVGQVVELIDASEENARLIGSIGTILSVYQTELKVQIPNFHKIIYESLDCWRQTDANPRKYVDGKPPEKPAVEVPQLTQTMTEAAELGEDEPAPKGAANLEENWPLPYGRRVKFVECHMQSEYWQGLIGRAGYVVKCVPVPKLYCDWRLIVKIDGEPVPVDQPLECWEDLGTQHDFSKPVSTAQEEQRHPCEEPLTEEEYELLDRQLAQQPTTRNTWLVCEIDDQEENCRTISTALPIEPREAAEIYASEIDRNHALASDLEGAPLLVSVRVSHECVYFEVKGTWRPVYEAKEIAKPPGLELTEED